MTTARDRTPVPLGFVWPTVDPFLFCVHHLDAYPAGDERLGPKASLAGRDLGQDFAGKDGWRMYHGTKVPGFPQHPHRGFETITLARRGYIDHSDSLGATARFGGGDVQWMTAGAGIVHAEMFPLLSRTEGNTAELFQIWMNLPAKDKMAPPHFAMLWREQIPQHTFRDARGKGCRVTVIAGALGELKPPPPPPHSWAADPSHQVAIWTLHLEAGAQWEVPAAARGAVRVLYAFEGDVELDGSAIRGGHAVQVAADAPCRVVAGGRASELLLLQGTPIGEPVAQRGPFVMNTQAELMQAFADYRATQFGGWPWPSDDPVHARDAGRFARYPDGHTTRPPKSSQG